MSNAKRRHRRRRRKGRDEQAFRALLREHVRNRIRACFKDRWTPPGYVEQLRELLAFLDDRQNQPVRTAPLFGPADLS